MIKSRLCSPECCSLPPTMGGSEAGPEVMMGGGATKLEAMGGRGWCGPEAVDMRVSVLRLPT